MLSIDRFSQILEEIVEALPKEVFSGLNLGIGVVEGVRLNHSTASGLPAYILGEYRVHGQMGSGIVLFYGSFRQVYPNLSDDQTGRDIISEVIRHELTHHLEHRAGERDLIEEDRRRLSQM